MADERHQILIVEDDSAVRRLLRTMLEDEGYAVIEAKGERDALARLASHDVSLITLDLGLGRDNGLVLAQRIRARSVVPIIIVSGKGSDVDRIVGLEIGADDYISKPFNVREVLARVRAVMRRTASAVRTGDDFAARQAFQFDGWTCDVAARRLTRPDGTDVKLTSREFSLLTAFLRRPQRVLSRHQLMDFLGDDDADTLERAIDTIVGRLRRKLKTTDASPIETVRGSGYMFTVKVKSVEADGVPQSTSLAEPNARGT